MNQKNRSLGSNVRKDVTWALVLRFKVKTVCKKAIRAMGLKENHTHIHVHTHQPSHTVPFRSHFLHLFSENEPQWYLFLRLVEGTVAVFITVREN